MSSSGAGDQPPELLAAIAKLCDALNSLITGELQPEEVLAQLGRAQNGAPRYDLIRSSEAAKYLGVALVTIRRWSDEGRLGHYRIGQHRYFNKFELDAFMSRHRVPARK